MQRAADTPPPDSLDDIAAMLRLVRQNLGLDVAFIGEFTGGRRIFRHVDAAAPGPVREGGSDPLDETYCAQVVEGRLPELIPDTGLVARAHRMAVYYHLV